MKWSYTCLCLFSPSFCRLCVSLPFVLSCCHVNCWIPSLTCRHTSAPAVLSALSVYVHVYPIVVVCCWSFTACDPPWCQTVSRVFSSRFLPWSPGLGVSVWGGWPAVGGPRAGGAPQGLALHICNNLEGGTHAACIVVLFFFSSGGAEETQNYKRRRIEGE